MKVYQVIPLVVFGMVLSLILGYFIRGYQETQESRHINTYLNYLDEYDQIKDRIIEAGLGNQETIELLSKEHQSLRLRYNLPSAKLPDEDYKWQVFQLTPWDIKIPQP